MKLVMDLVVNHTSDEHPWFIESRSDKNNPKRDWYWWRGPRAGMRAGDSGAEPTNWESWFLGPAWTLDEASDEYYLHIFSRRQPDLNWENPEVRQQVYAMMRWWLDRGVDGFRMDVINFISKDPALPDGHVREGALYGDGAPSFICGPRNHEFLQEMNREVFAGRDTQLLTVGEMPGVTVDEAALFTDPSRGEVDMVFQFEHVDLDHGATKWDHRHMRLTDLKTSFGRWQTGLQNSGWNSLYWDNHDQPRVVSRWGDDTRYRIHSATMLATVLHMHRGTPYVFQGEEIGMTNMPFANVEELRDIESLNYYAEAMGSGTDPGAAMAAIRRIGRDNARTPMQWDGSVNAGFSAGTPWIGVNPNFANVNVAAARNDNRSILHHYRKLIELRHSEPVVVHGDFTMLLPNDEQLYAFTRRLNDVELLVVGNFSDATRALGGLIDGNWESATLLLGNYPDDRVPSPLTPLRAWEARVYRRARPPRAAQAR